MDHGFWEQEGTFKTYTSRKLQWTQNNKHTKETRLIGHHHTHKATNDKPKKPMQ
jgi:hypothetical protein